MKVIKKTVWAHQLECTECHSILEIEEADVVARDYEYRVTDYSIKCPCCEQFFPVNANEIPGWVQQKAIWRHNA